jgi:hypothetical protein
MLKVAWSLLACAVLAASCGSSDDRKSAREAEAGAGGEPADSGAGVSNGGSNEPAAPAGGQPGSAGEGGAGDARNDAGGPSEPDVVAGAAGAIGAGGAGPVVLEEGGIVDVPYVCESPFDGVAFDSYFYLDDFEDAALSTPGVSAPNTVSSLTGFGASVVDSVDCNDGAVDGSCLDCDALYGQGTIEFSFDAEVLGELPTHVGLVWTDGGAGASVSITGYDEADTSIYSQTVEGLGDVSVAGTVEEDRFFGIVHFGGIKRVVIVNSTGGLEIDHLQYGR